MPQTDDVTSGSVCESKYSQYLNPPPSDMDDYGGMLLPLFQSEHLWPTWLRVVLYSIGLMWAFLGVGIVADQFMVAIEVITSKEKVVKMPDGASVTVNVWNATVANLTLMALGSSAPEILLSVIEILTADFYSGELGPSTIVGSAAFNLLMILAVCVASLPPGTQRRIDELGVYSVTAFFSIFAYVWLLFIVSWHTKDIIDPWEAILTFIYFPVLVLLAYMADCGYFTRSGKVTPLADHIIGMHGQKSMFHAFEASEYLRKFGNHDPEATAEIMAQLAVTKKKPSRAELRSNALRSMTGRKTVNFKQEMKLRGMVASAEAGVEGVPSDQAIFFEVCEYAGIESNPTVALTLCRSGSVGTVSVRVFSEDGSAQAGKDFEPFDEAVTFAAGESEKVLEIKIIDDEEVEEDEDFLVKVDASTIKAEGVEGTVTVREEAAVATVTIIDDDEPGQLGFKPANTAVTVVESSGFAEVVVSRMNGAKGEIGCTIKTKDMSAKVGTDYEEVEQVLSFAPAEVTKVVRVPIVNTSSYDKHEQFKLELSEPTGIRADLAEHTECIVTVVTDENTKKVIDTVQKLVDAKMSGVKNDGVSYCAQIRAAFEIEVEEEGQAPTPFELFMHVFTLPWKVLFSFIPPAEWYGGWLCFWTSLLMIGLVTALIGDMANIFGCLISFKPLVTAITFVALGTSLPDTFASRAAAIGDTNADASIGNVTGSNSVNVFLGLGMPWTIAALYWQSKGRTTAWQQHETPDGEKYGDLFPEADYPNGGFVVIGGSLSVSVMTFTACGAVCMAILQARRMSPLIGSELGGPLGTERYQYATAAALALLWITYILVSALNA